MYPILKWPQTLVHQPNESVVLFDIKDVGEAALVVNKLAGDILERCNGLSNSEDIIADLVSTKLIDPGQEQLVLDFFQEASMKGIISIVNTPTNASMRIFGNRNYWTPSMIVMELTHCCNLYCEYCYREAGDSGCEGFCNTDRIRSLICEMKELGIRRIQLTGGEPTLHPNFADILELCKDLSIFVNVITNGFQVQENCIEAMKQLNQKQGVIQVSVDGSREVHDTIRNRIGSYDCAIDLISKLSESGVAVDVAATVWGQKIEELEHVCKLAKMLGARSFRASPLLQAGRAANGSNRITQNQVVDMLNSLAEKYRCSTFFVASTDVDCPKESHRSNICGAGSRILRITPSFAVTPCPLLDYTLGSVAHNQLKTLLENKDTKFDRLISPSDTVCDECQNSIECNGCFKRALSISEETVTCKWRLLNSNYFDELI